MLPHFRTGFIEISHNSVKVVHFQIFAGGRASDRSIIKKGIEFSLNLGSSSFEIMVSELVVFGEPGVVLTDDLRLNSGSTNWRGSLGGCDVGHDLSCLGFRRTDVGLLLSSLEGGLSLSRGDRLLGGGAAGEPSDELSLLLAGGNRRSGGSQIVHIGVVGLSHIRAVDEAGLSLFPRADTGSRFVVRVPLLILFVRGLVVDNLGSDLLLGLLILEDSDGLLFVINVGNGGNFLLSTALLLEEGGALLDLGTVVAVGHDVDGLVQLGSGAILSLFLALK